LGYDDRFKLNTLKYNGKTNSALGPSTSKTPTLEVGVLEVV